MATSGTTTGLANIPRLGRDADLRIRRVVQWFQTDFVAKDGGVVVNGQGQLDTSPAVVFRQLLAYEQANPAFLGRL